MFHVALSPNFPLSPAVAPFTFAVDVLKPRSRSSPTRPIVKLVIFVVFAGLALNVFTALRTAVGMKGFSMLMAIPASKNDDCSTEPVTWPNDASTNPVMRSVNSISACEYSV